MEVTRLAWLAIFIIMVAVAKAAKQLLHIAETAKGANRSMNKS